MPITPSAPHPIEQLVSIMARLRDPIGGCPWDKEQDFASIAPYTIEEAYEVADAIERGDMADLKDELGDLLLQVIYHSRMAEEVGAFKLDDVVASICDKMIRRHPHVFGDDDVVLDDDHKARWEAQKADERGREQSALAGVAIALPALLRAEKIQRRAARIGFDWPDHNGAREKIEEELRECDAAQTPDELSDEIGDLLFSVVNWARHLGVDGEAALKRSTQRFEQRFVKMEESIAPAKLSDCDAQQMEALWAEAKRALSSR